MLLNNRHGSVDSDAYRYGFNGMERDDEVKGEGNSYTTLFRQYDPRLARWKSIDPKSVAWDSPYSFSRNSVLVFNDPLGDCPDGNCDDKKTPGGGNISIPKGSATVTNPSDNSVHVFKYRGVNWYYNNDSENYETISGLNYSEKFALELDTRNRWEIALQNRLSELLAANPHRKFQALRGSDGILIESYPNNDQYPDTFYEDTILFSDYPEVGTGESMIPFWGSGKSAMYNIEDGEYGWAAINIGMAVSDVFLIKSIAKGGMSGGFKIMTKNYKNWSSYRSILGQEGFANSGQHVHHWLFYKGGKSGSGTWWKMKNQMWNLTPMSPRIWKGNIYSGRAIHMAIHGKSNVLKLTQFEKSFMKVLTAPNWAKAFTGSVGFRGINEFKD
ncbi:hypothetical protein IL45_02365 [Nonlabens ulvanivorans]|uniref:RHS repeat-associated protein n=1 Tax=Nonlabens ulvanivorans TaxID=906888 RepID=A0A084JYH6_NONUL|nr:hypothetical protein IL45_02365 [Nonlabens ulvanivorans]PRX11040.1 RHS repeat-associated protein [Nonlabens ulvanivorans]